MRRTTNEVPIPVERGAHISICALALESGSIRLAYFKEIVKIVVTFSEMISTRHLSYVRCVDLLEFRMCSTNKGWVLPKGLLL